MLPTLTLIDSSALAARAFFRAGGLSLTSLKPALDCFESLTVPLLEVEQVIATFEGDTNYRREIYPAYKAARKKKPELLSELLAALPVWFAARGIACLKPGSGEADDALATLTERYLPLVLRGELRIAVASFDGDLLALSYAGAGGSGVYPLTFERGAWRCHTPEEIQGRYGVPAGRIELFKAIAGDSGDGIPGISGLGPVAARRLATQFASIPALYRNLEAVPRPERSKCDRFGLDSALLMARLTTLQRRAELVSHV